MNYSEISLLDELNSAIETNPAVLFYFSTPTCNVCKVLKPKVAEMIENDFPRIKLFYIDIEKAPLLSGQFSVFTIPSLMVFFEGKEYIRKSRNIGISELKGEIERPYGMLFEKG